MVNSGGLFRRGPDLSIETPAEWQYRLQRERLSKPAPTQPSTPPAAPKLDPQLAAFRREVTELEAENTHLKAEVAAREKQLGQKRRDDQAAAEAAKLARREKGFAANIRFSNGGFNAFKKSK